MVDRCDTAAVLGAGVMGSAIAAHLAGAGIRTHLLDIVPPDLSEAERQDPTARNRIAATGLQRATKAKPPAFFDPAMARDIVVGNVEDHLDRLGDCDLVIEAVVERMDIKQALLKRVAPHLAPHAVLASNTSGLSIAEMTSVLPAEVQDRFLVMHFFNPVRYMRLLELVAGPRTKPEIMAWGKDFGERLGKGIVFGKDTANFVANRIGVYGMLAAFVAMEEEGLSVEAVDAVMGRPTGRPKSAVFRTADIVGIDTLAHVAQNCYDALPNDEARDTFKVPALVQRLIDDKRLGQKSGRGFYAKEGKTIRVLDTTTFEYRDMETPRFAGLDAAKKEKGLPARLRTLVKSEDPAGRFAWKVLSRTLAYAANRVGEIADDIVNIDRAMRWGFNWDLGPFETWDALGVGETVVRMQQDGLSVAPWVINMLESGRQSFYGQADGQETYFDVAKKSAMPVPTDPKALKLAAVKQKASHVVAQNLGASLVDLGDGCLGLEVHTKMNTIDDDVIKMIHQAADEAEKNFDALVVGNDGEHFGAGANLMMIFMAAKQGQWDTIENMVSAFQGAMQRLRYARVPVVSAPFQYTFGGGAELAMAADATQAHAETYMGLVEVGAGLVPAGAGCLRMLERWTENVRDVDGAELLPHVGAASLNIAMAKVSSSAEEARSLRFLRATDGISLNRDHLLAAAKARALGMAAAGYQAPRAPVLRAAGYDAAKTISMRIWGMVEGGWASAHDALIANKIGRILCGGDVAAGSVVSEQAILDLEREAFLSLCGEEKSQARMQSLLSTNKPLRN